MSSDEEELELFRRPLVVRAAQSRTKERVAVLEVEDDSPERPQRRGKAARGSSSTSRKRRHHSSDSSASSSGEDAPRRRAGKASAAAPRPLQPYSSKHSHFSIDSSPDRSQSQSQSQAVGKPPKPLASGDGLRQMAKAHGWVDHGQPEPEPDIEPTPPRKVTKKRKAPSPAPPARSSDATLSDVSRMSRSSIRSSPLTIPSSEEPAPNPPPPPVAFWGAGPEKVVNAAKSARKPAGSAFKELAALSTLRKKMDVAVVDMRNANNDEDLDEDKYPEGGAECVAAPSKKYESVEAKKKRERMEAAAALAAKRASKNQPKSGVPHPVAPAPPPAAKTANVSDAKGKAKVDMQICAVCSKEFPASELPSHFTLCFARLERADAATKRAEAANSKSSSRPTPPVSIGRPPPRPAKVATSSEHPDLAAKLFPPSPPPAAQHPVDVRAKGKARAENQEEDEDEYPFIDVPDDEWERFDYVGGQGNRLFEEEEEYEMEQGEQGDFEEDFEEEDVVPQPRKASSGRIGRAGHKGPMPGSSPPAGSIYISTLSTELREGYEAMYGEKASPRRRKAAGASQAAKPARKPAGRGRGRGGWSRRGRGARRGGKR